MDEGDDLLRICNRVMAGANMIGEQLSRPVIACDLCGSEWTDGHAETCCYVTNSIPGNPPDTRESA